MRIGMFYGLFAIMAAATGVTAGAIAQEYPTRPIRVITTAGAGGTSDIFMRALGESLQKRLGQPFIMEARPGGSFNIGARVRWASSSSA